MQIAQAVVVLCFNRFPSMCPLLLLPGRPELYPLPRAPVQVADAAHGRPPPDPLALPQRPPPPPPPSRRAPGWRPRWSISSRWKSVLASLWRRQTHVKKKSARQWGQTTNAMLGLLNGAIARFDDFYWERLWRRGKAHTSSSRILVVVCTHTAPGLHIWH